MRRRYLGALGLLLFSVGVTRPAAAQSIIRHPGDHPKYVFEAEPHLAVDPFRATGFGPGFRGTVVLVDNGFVSSINNSVGIGFGLDWVFYGHGATDVMLPLVLQWNFWLHPDWSVFGEPGVTLHLRGGNGDRAAFDVFSFYGGGRYHFNESVSLTLRVGAPIIRDTAVSVGVSFFL
jgi:hypothetical protein